MIIEAIILSLIIIKLCKLNFKNFNDFKLKNLKMIFMGLFLNLILIFFTQYDLGIITKIIIDYFYYLNILSYLLMIIGLLSNYRNIGILIMAFGLISNLIPIILNGRMPVDYNALLKINNEHIYNILINNKSLTHGLYINPSAKILTDIIPLHIPLFQRIISIGDILLSIGIFLSFIIISRRNK